MKKITAALLAALLLVLSLSGCYKTDAVLTIDGEKIAPGFYLAFQFQAVSEAAAELDNAYTGKALYDQEIDGVPVRDWIRGRTVELAKDFVFINREFARLELEQTEVNAEMLMYESSLQSNWAQISYTYNRNGISYGTYRTVYENYIKTNHVFRAIYAGDDPLIPTTDDEIKDYFIEKYTYLDYLRLQIPAQGEDQSDEDYASALADLRAMMQSLLQAAEAGAAGQDPVYQDELNIGIEAAFEQYAETQQPLTEDEKYNLHTNTVLSQALINADSTDYDAGLLAHLFAAPYNGYSLYETATNTYLICRRSPLEDNPDGWTEYRDTVIAALKGGDFTEYREEKSSALETVENQRARNYYSIDKIKA